MNRGTGAKQANYNKPFSVISPYFLLSPLLFFFHQRISKVDNASARCIFLLHTVLIHITRLKNVSLTFLSSKVSSLLFQKTAAPSPGMKHVLHEGTELAARQPSMVVFAAY